MENGLVDLSTGTLIVDNKKVSIGMTLEEVLNTFDKIKSRSQFINKEKQNCTNICLFTYNIYNIPAETRIFLHNEVVYKIFVSFDANDTVIDIFDENLNHYKEKAIQTIKNLRNIIKDQYSNIIDYENGFYIIENNYKLNIMMDKFLLECSANIEKE